MDTRVVMVAPLVLLVGCGAGPYGHSRTYAPLDAEAAALAGCEEYDPVMSKRQPEEWAKKKVSLFGVVVRRDDPGGGAGYLTLSVRTLEPRNLCETASEDSCRTTVSTKEHDKVHAKIAFATPEDEAGAASIGQGSLVRLVGGLAPTPDASDGAPVFLASFYRHWPRGFYVTNAAASVLRR